MKAIKEFLKPNRWKVILLLPVFPFFVFLRIIIGFNLNSFGPEELIMPLVGNWWDETIWVIWFVEAYLLSCFIYLVIKHLMAKTKVVMDNTQQSKPYTEWSAVASLALSLISGICFLCNFFYSILPFIPSPFSPRVFLFPVIIGLILGMIGWNSRKWVFAVAGIIISFLLMLVTGLLLISVA